MPEETMLARPGPFASLAVAAIVLLSCVVVLSAVRSYGDVKDQVDNQNLRVPGSEHAAYQVLYAVGTAALAIGLALFATKPSRMTWGPRAALLIAAAFLAVPGSP